MGKPYNATGLAFTRKGTYGLNQEESAVQPKLILRDSECFQVNLSESAKSVAGTQVSVTDLRRMDPKRREPRFEKVLFTSQFIQSEICEANAGRTVAPPLPTVSLTIRIWPLKRPSIGPYGGC